MSTQATPVRPTVYPRDLHLAENLSPEQEKMREAITKLARATDPHQGGYEHTETVETVEYLHHQVVLVSQGFAALLNAETPTEPETAACAKRLGQASAPHPCRADSERTRWSCCDHCTDGPSRHQCSTKGDHTTSCPICDRASTVNVMTADVVADRDREIERLNALVTEQSASINRAREALGAQPTAQPLTSESSEVTPQ